jgi:hypothetical protein
MMVDGQLGYIAESPTAGGEVDGQKFFFPADEEARLEPADLQKRRAPEDRSARKETQQRWARHARFTR